jgi:peptidoglycan/LPS O-acetylase OafA/YrhL
MAILSEEFNYRPEVDGLRALAVLAVVFYHAHLGFPGGYVGVDVFFVISGFLITSLIVKDLDQNRSTLAHFWERRARRILPAAVVVTLSTLVAGWFFLVPLDYAALGESAAHQAIFSANFFFRRTVGYFNDATERMPLLHTWSLAVEEQFYMVVPLLLYGLYRFPRLRQRRTILGLFLIGIAFSLHNSQSELSDHPSVSFYFLHPRAWELLVGCALAILPRAYLPRARILREAGSLVGLAAILIPCFVYDYRTPFPGLAALPPCLGAALFIWANAPVTAERPLLGCALATRPVVFVGLISYSLYLWHWPILAFARYTSFEPLSLEYRLGLLALGLVLSVLSWRYVEMPFRKRQFCATRKSIFIFAGAGLTAVLTAGVCTLLTEGFPQRLPPLAKAYAYAKKDRANLASFETEGSTEVKIRVIGKTGTNQPPSVLVWGDSHAVAALPAFDAFLKEKGLAGRAALHAALAPVLNYTSRADRSGAWRRHNDSVFNYIVEQKIPNVILAARWKNYGNPQSVSAALTPIEPYLLTTVQRLAQSGTRVWILLQVPEHTIDVPIALARSVLLNRNIDDLCARPESWNGLAGRDDGILRKLEAAGARWIDPRPRFLDAGGTRYVVAAEGAALYFDQHHLSVKGALLMLLPLLRDEFDLTPSSNGPREPATP